MNSASLLFIPIILVVGYLLLIRPQQMRVRQQQSLLASLKPGDEVITAGGMVGTVQSMDGDRVSLEVAPGTTVVFLRQAVARKLNATDEPVDDQIHDREDDD